MPLGDKLSSLFGDDSKTNVDSLESDKALVEWANRTFERLRQERVPIERQWYVNLAYFFGRQNIAVIDSTASTTGFVLTIPKAPPWRVRMVINHVRRIVRTETAKLTSQRPHPYVIPNTTEDEDLAAARIGEQILESQLSGPEINQTIRSWVWWASVTGTAFLKQSYDKNSKDRNGDKGEIKVERVNSFELFVPDMVQENIEQQSFVLHATTWDTDKVEEVFGKKVMPNANGMTDVLNDQFLNLVGAAQQKRDKKVLVLEYWIKPGGHPSFPKGGVLTVGGDKVLQIKREFPYNHEEYPFYKLVSIFSGKFYGESVIVDSIPVQKELNKTRSQVIEIKNLLRSPRMYAYKGSVNPKLISSEPGQVIGVVPGFEYPQVVDPPQLPQYVSELESRLYSDLDDISGQHEITRGDNPSQVTAATALAYLQEQDDTKLSYTVASLEDAFSKLGRHHLKLFAQYMTSQRLIKVVGRDGLMEVNHWKANDLRGNTDVRVEAGSGLPRSKAAKQAFIMELFKFQPFPPERMMEMLDLQGIDKIYEETLADKRQAQRENLIMSKLTPDKIDFSRGLEAQITGEDLTHTPLIRANDYDNHQLHIYYHNLYRKSQSYEILPRETKAEFEKHVLMHRIALQEGTAPMSEQKRAELNPEEAQQQQQEQPPGQEPQEENLTEGQQNG